jgi:hypothetical protein
VRPEITKMKSGHPLFYSDLIFSTHTSIISPAIVVFPGLGGINSAANRPDSGTDRGPLPGAPSTADYPAQQRACGSSPNRSADYITSTLIVMVGIISGIGITVRGIGAILVISLGRTRGNCRESQT